MIDFNKFTNYSKEIVASAQNIMAENKNFEMQPEHLLMAMVKDVEGVAGDYLKELGILKHEELKVEANNNDEIKLLANYNKILNPDTKRGVLELVCAIAKLKK